MNTATIVYSFVFGAALGAAVERFASRLVGGLRRGSCRTTAVSALFALLTAALASLSDSAAQFAVALTLLCVLVAAALTDLDTGLIPNRLTLPGLALILTLTVLFQPALLTERVSFAFLAFTFFLAAALLRPGAMGLGDVKLVAVIGAGLGGACVAGLLLGLVGGAIAGLVIAAKLGWQRARSATVPLAPFLAGGALIIMLLAG